MNTSAQSPTSSDTSSNTVTSTSTTGTDASVAQPPAQPNPPTPTGTGTAAGAPPALPPNMRPPTNMPVATSGVPIDEPPQPPATASTSAGVPEPPVQSSASTVVPSSGSAEISVPPSQPTKMDSSSDQASMPGTDNSQTLDISASGSPDKVAAQAAAELEKMAATTSPEVDDSDTSAPTPGGQAGSANDTSPAPQEIEGINGQASNDGAAATDPQQPTQQPTPSPTPQPDGSQIGTNQKFGNLLEVLVANGALTQEQGNELQVENISTGKKIESILKERNLVTEEQLTQAMATLRNIPFVKLSDVGIYPEAINQLPEGSARHYQMVPFAYDKDKGTLSVAMKDPLDLTAIDFAQQKTGLRIMAFYAMPSEVEKTIAEYYSQTLSSEVSAALEQTTQVAEAQKKKQDLSQLGNETIRSAPITKIVETMVTFAMKARASDIHVEPLEDRTRIRYRIDGILNEKLILPKSVHDAVVSRIKILSGLKIDEKRLPQDGRFTFSVDEQEVDLRVSTLPTIHGEKVVMRLLKKDIDVPSLPDLGMNGLALTNVEQSIKVPHGIILITGPTGSGKTTTLYSILHKISTPKVNIMTLEDPVEYEIAGVNQVQVNPQAGLTFASGLRSFLRQDPNIIMVGEIRDSETAELAIQAALTGHLVFSTLHTSSAAGALPRLMDMGAEPFLLASSMTLVMAQRVLRRINPDFKEEYKPEPAVIKDIQNVLGERLTAWCKKKNIKPEDITLFRPKADRPQTEPEYKGRVAIFEVMKVTEQIGHLILERKPASEMEKLAVANGMLYMKQDGYIKALEGVTTIEEVLRVAQI